MLGSESDTMEVFQDLCIYNPSNLKLAEALNPEASSLWHRSPKTEENIRNNGGDSLNLVVYKREESCDIRASLLVFHVNEDSWKVANIVPDQIDSLGVKSYNDVLNDFVEHVLRPVAEKENILWNLTKRQQTITDWTSIEAAEALRTFSGLANKSTGSSQPADACRWREYLIADHVAGSTMTESQFRWWLINVHEWSPHTADSLVSEREQAREILRDYDKVLSTS